MLDLMIRYPVLGRRSWFGWFDVLLGWDLYLDGMGFFIIICHCNIIIVGCNYLLTNESKCKPWQPDVCHMLLEEGSYTNEIPGFRGPMVARVPTGSSLKY